MYKRSCNYKSHYTILNTVDVVCVLVAIHAYLCGQMPPNNCKICWLRGPVACPQCLKKLSRPPQKIAADIIAAAIDAT